MQRTDYQRISNNLTAAVDTGNRDAADEAFAEALLADGKTIDADDLIFSIRRLTDPQLASPYAALLHWVDRDNLVKLDNRTVRLGFREGRSYLPLAEDEELTPRRRPLREEGLVPGVLLAVEGVARGVGGVGRCSGEGCAARARARRV